MTAIEKIFEEENKTNHFIANSEKKIQDKKHSFKKKFPTIVDSSKNVEERKERFNYNDHIQLTAFDKYQLLSAVEIEKIWIENLTKINQNKNGGKPQ